MDFSKLKYNPKGTTFKADIVAFNHYEKEIKNNKLDLVKVVAYVSMMYDINSDIHKEHEIYEERKKWAAVEAGMSLKDVWVIAMMGMKIGVVNEIITQFFMIQNNSKFELYITLMESYTQLLRIIRDPISDDDDDKLKSYKIKEELKKQAISAQKDIEEVSKDLFTLHEEVTSIVKESVDKIKKNRRGSTNYVEKMAFEGKETN